MSKETQALEQFVQKLKGLTSKEISEVMAGLDPGFTRDVFRHMLSKMDGESRGRLVKAARRMEEDYRPETPDELYAFVLRETGLKIPRKAVCHGHCAPFDFFSDVYFEEGNPDKLAVGNRGSGKTQLMGLLHAVNSRTKKQYTSCTIGAVEAQSLRAYGFFKEIAVQRDGWKRLVKDKVLMGHTEFINGSVIEIVVGTMTGVNSPHPILAHWDEVELLRPGVFDEGLNMAQSKHGHKAQNTLTSSWKKPKGFVTSLVDGEEDAKRDGLRPPYQIYRWCVWETTTPCPHDCNACPFSVDVKGKWEDDSPRSFESACKRGSPEPGVGKLKFTDGFVEVEDQVGRFRKLPRRVWEAQQESKRPTLEGLVYDIFDEDSMAVELWDPDPEIGPITAGLDFGAKNPHAAVFVQHLNVDVRWGRMVLPEGSDVIFDEVYIAQVGNIEFGRRINQRIEYWRTRYPDFEVMNFYRDPAAKAAGLDLATMSSFADGLSPDERWQYTNIPTLSMGHVDVEDRIALLYEQMGHGMFYVDKIRCDNWMDEIGGYDRNENTGKPCKEDDHLMDAMGYRWWNVHAAKRFPQKNSRPLYSAPRPRAIGMRGPDGPMWDPQKLGQVPQYGQGQGEPTDSSNQVGIVRRPRLGRDIFE